MKQTAYLIALIALIFLLWPYPILDPLKLLVVFFHEGSHALATVASGGSVDELVIVKNQGGHVLSRGGNRFVILSAGYLGSLCWGVLIYCFAANSRLDRIGMSVLGLLIIAITVRYGSGLFSWGFGLSAGCAMLAAAYFLDGKANDFLLRLIA
ncbi:MAG: M50 family metallopeptidase, partial [Gammaproteobacteria bacterium]